MNSICSLRFTYQDALGEFVTALRLPEDCLSLGGPTDRNSYTGSVRIAHSRALWCEAQPTPDDARDRMVADAGCQLV